MELGRRAGNGGPTTGSHALPATGDGVVRIVLGANNVFALPDGHGLTLIDAGPDFDGSWAELCAALVACGWTPADVHTVVLTHHHLDHAGLAAHWQALGARILAGRHDADALAMDEKAREQERAQVRAVLLRNGIPPVAMTDQRRPAPLRMTPLRPDRLLDDGDLVNDHGRPLRVIACPGHTPGTIVLQDSVSGVLFTGDHLLPHMTATPGIQLDGGRRRPSLPAYLASLHRLGAACRFPSPVRAYPGHGEPMDDAGAAMDWAIRHLERRAERVLTHVRRGPGTAYAITTRLFPHLDARHARAATVETLGLLDLLATRGLARAEEDETLTTWWGTDEALRCERIVGTER